MTKEEKKRSEILRSIKLLKKKLQKSLISKYIIYEIK